MNLSFLTIIFVEAILVSRETIIHYEVQKKRLSIFSLPRVSRTVSQLSIPGVTEGNIHDQAREVPDPKVIP